MSADPRFDLLPPAPGPAQADDVAAWAFSLTRGLRSDRGGAGWLPSTPALELLPPAGVDLDDDGDLPTLASQLDHEPDGAL